MLCALIAVLCALLAAERAAGDTTKCTVNACFTLHTEKVEFQKAAANCYENGGYSITIRDDNDFDVVRSLLAPSGKLSVREKVWIGLKLPKGNCVRSDEGLRGFRWTSGTPDSSYSNWRKEPRSTCTEERCVSISASAEDLKWSDGSCKTHAMYMCVNYFRGMCKPLLFAGPGEVNYTLPFLKVPVKHDSGLDMLPYGTFAEISCAYDGDTNTRSVCKEKHAHFVWEKPGPFCASSQRVCKNRNGGCDQLCFEDETEVRCECKEDYYLGDDKVTCFLKDACRNSPCDHKCTSKPTGFVCTCLEGFELSEDHVSCKDVDECTQDICNGHLCHNKRGGYECACKKGYKDVDGLCEDIDECAESVCAHHAKCLNSEGSFSCYCSPGFRKHKEQCVDIDECVSRPCEGICSNTDGSFTCSCSADFHLAENGVSCVPDQERAHDFETLFTTRFNHPGITTVTPGLGTNTTAETHQSVSKGGSVVGSWVLVYALSSLIPFLLLITLTAVIAMHRWNRMRKDAKKKSVTADSYCWVSSGYTNHLETQRNRIY